MSWARNVPNLLSLIRLAATPWLATLIIGRRYEAALALSIGAGLTDALDGFLARRFGWTTVAGAYLDPIADKLMLGLTYFAFWFTGHVPGWLAAVILGRDLMILFMAGAALLFTDLRHFPPSLWGKISTAIQIAAAAALLASLAAPEAGLAILVGPAFYLAAAATTWSGVHYLWRGISMLRGLRLSLRQPD